MEQLRPGRTTIPRCLHALAPAFLCSCIAAVSTGGDSSGAMDAAASSNGDPRDAGTQADATAPERSTRVDSSRPADRTPVDRMPDQPPFVFPPVMCAANVIFCEDFEAGLLNPATWTVTGWGGGYGDGPIETTVTVDTMQHMGGKSALHLKVLKPNSPTMVRQAFVKSTMTFAVPGDQNLFIRYFMYLDNPTPNRWMTFFAARDEVDSYGMQLLPQSETMAGPVVYFPWAGTQHPQLAQAVPLGRWACWEYEFRTAGNEMLLEVESQPVAGLDLKGGPTLGKAALYFGVLNSHEDIIAKPNGFNIWIDDIAVSHQRIGCAP